MKLTKFPALASVLLMTFVLTGCMGGDEEEAATPPPATEIGAK